MNNDLEYIEDEFDDEVGVARSTDPETSHAAARSINFAYLFDAILGGLAAHPEGQTTEDLSKNLGIGIQTVSPCIIKMQRRGLLVRNGDKRRNSTGKLALICRLPQGHEETIQV